MNTTILLPILAASIAAIITWLATRSVYLQKITRLQSETDFLKQRTEDQQKQAAENEKRLTERFENLSNQLLKNQTEEFNKHSSNKLGELLNPVMNRIQEFGKALQDHRESQIKDHSSLKEQIVSLTSLNQIVTEETKNLTKALKGESQTRGTWGEMILEVILEKSGLRKGEHYVVQKSFAREGDEGSGRPDVVLNLPDKKNLIIDSKVALVAYDRAMQADTDEERQQQLKLHAAAVKEHIKTLAAQNYDQLYEINTPDFVFLFTPIEGALYSALEIDPGLYDFALSKNIALTAPTMLIATLRIVQNLWKQEAQSNNIVVVCLEIVPARKARKSLRRFCIFITYLGGNDGKKFPKAFRAANLL